MLASALMTTATGQAPVVNPYEQPSDVLTGAPPWRRQASSAPTANQLSSSSFWRVVTPGVNILDAISITVPIVLCGPVRR